MKDTRNNELSDGQALPERKSSKSGGRCPYAMNFETASSSSTPAPSSPMIAPLDHENLTPVQALQLAKISCPAFNLACPFRDVQDADGMKKALSSLPASHVAVDMRDEKKAGEDMRGEEQVKIDSITESLKVALTHVHAISQSLPSSSKGNGNGESTSVSGRSRAASFSLPGGCPFKTQYSSDATFGNATEIKSIFGLMAKVIEKQEVPLSNPDTKEKLNVNSLKPAMTQADVPESSGTMKRVRSTTSLSNALKTGTQESHSAAESVHFVKEFIKGNIDRDLYSILILNLFYLYERLEKLLDDHAPHQFSNLHFPKELKRTETLREDVDFFLGDVDVLKQQQKSKPSPATLDYIRRVEEISETEPLLLLSHAYTRYLGDLSGGKVLARVAKRAMNLQGGDDGLSFYNFEHIPSAKVFKDGYRKALDDLDLTDGQIQRLVAEANVAFVLNMRIFEELDVMSGIEGSMVRDYNDAVNYYDDCVRMQKSNIAPGILAVDEEDGGADDIKKCPFAMLGGPNPHKMSIPSKEASSSDKDHDLNSDIDNGAGKVHQMSVETKKMNTVSAASQGNNTAAAAENKINKTSSCPWPFVFFHDFDAGIRDWHTWAVIGLTLCYGLMQWLDLH
uniref:Uncharacterized protein n=1 Tax=Chaetoceros debilis TaxID=122233 RepID=A0A7S3VB53_9STRA